VEDIYKAKPISEPNIIDTINKNSCPKSFIGKNFDFQDPKNHESTFSSIETCEFMTNDKGNFAVFTLQDNNIMRVEYDAHNVLSVFKRFRKK
jgi:hypothetical protein